jgi:hypothetical protein
MVHRGVAALALALTTCFLLLSYFDSQFSLIHVYESLIYLLIVLALFYSEGRWAYMLGIVAPAGWLLLMFHHGRVWRNNAPDESSAPRRNTGLCCHLSRRHHLCALGRIDRLLRLPLEAQILRPTERTEHLHGQPGNCSGL